MSDSDWKERVGNSKRLAALAATALSDSEAEDAFDRLTRLSAELLDSPTALVSLVDERRQFFKSAVGLDEPWASRRETPLSHSFCKYVVARGEALVVSDARESPLVSDNAAVTELGVIAYAGVPLTALGEPIGAFCVIDQKPRAWSEDNLRLLREIARAVEAQIALRLANRALAEREQTLSQVLDAIPAGVLIRDVAGASLRINPALATLLGRSEAELLATDFWDITHPDDLPGDSRSREELLEGDRKTVTRTKRYRHAQGHYIWVRLQAALLRSVDGQVEGTVATITDITAEREAEEALARQARIYHTIARSIPRGAVLLFDRDMRYLAADGADVLSSIGLEQSDIEGRTLRDIANPRNVDFVESKYREALAGNTVELEGVRNGRTLLTRVAPVWGGDGVTGGIALVQDVTEERRQVELVRRAKELFEVTIANVRDGVVVLDANHTVVYANRAYAELLAFDPDKLVGSGRPEFLAHVAPMMADPAEFTARIEQPSPGPLGASDEFTLLRPKKRHVRRTIAPLQLPDGPGHIVIWHDISAEVELLAERDRQALTDSLTGIANRRAAEAALAKERACAERASTPLSIALFDIDYFKQVNDQYGHGAGDEVLKRVAATIDRAKRLTDTVARWGGEEFIAVLPVPLEGAVAFCERVRKEISELVCPGVGRVTISAGVAQLNQSESIESWLKRADQRLYSAKSSGRNRVES
ncbi:MAG TPA: diguanylate cyclase [Polyangiaceae bacterium]|nr:diguanylate cyclase [Polyangiaceae bacterium]